MPLDSLPGTLIVKTRDEIRNDYLRDYQLFNPGADVSEGTQPWIDASALADQLTPIYYNSQVAANRVLVKKTQGTLLDEIGEAEGVIRQQATGGSGFVRVTTSTGGAQVFAGDEIREPKSGLRYQVTQTGTYSTGDLVPIAGLDTGPSTNLAVGTPMKFTTPRYGCSPDALVAATSGGAGLTGGGNVEDDAAYQDRIVALRQNRPASGNDADYQATIETTPGVAVQKAFTYPAALGPGTMAFAFTVPPAAPGGSRIPSAAQLAAALTYVSGKMPADDMIFAMSIAPQAVPLVFSVRWTQAAQGWVDQTPWPPYYPASASLGAPSAIVVDAYSTITATLFTLVTSNGSYSGVPQPAPGNTIAFFNPATGKFVRKRILTAVGGGPWVITVDTSNAASDTVYAPAAGTRAGPWAASLDAVGGVVLPYMDGIGPGEVFAEFEFFDPGVRRRRSPLNPKTWPNSITNRILQPVLALAEVQDAQNLEGVGTTPAIGYPGVMVCLLGLSDLGIFPQ